MGEQPTDHSFEVYPCIELLIALFAFFFLKGSTFHGDGLFGFPLSVRLDRDLQSTAVYRLLRLGNPGSRQLWKQLCVLVCFSCSLCSFRLRILSFVSWCCSLLLFPFVVLLGLAL